MVFRNGIPDVPLERLAALAKTLRKWSGALDTGPEYCVPAGDLHKPAY